jgi:hypothetical protein
MSAAPVIAEYTDAEKNERRSEIWRWLISFGVCDMCASGWAIARVEKEMGDRAWKPWPSRCTKVDRLNRTCAAIAKENAASLPKLGRKL